MVPNYPSGLLKFYIGVYEMVDNPSLDSVISWSKSNKSFVIWNHKELIHRKILSRLYCSKLSDFISELERYGFVRIKGNLEQLEFGHEEYFVRGQPDLLKKLHIDTGMRRMKKKIKVIRAIKAKTQVENRLQHLRI